MKKMNWEEEDEEGRDEKEGGEGVGGEDIEILPVSFDLLFDPLTSELSGFG